MFIIASAWSLRTDRMTQILGDKLLDISEVMISDDAMHTKTILLHFLKIKNYSLDHVVPEQIQNSLCQWMTSESVNNELQFDGKYCGELYVQIIANFSTSLLRIVNWA